MCALLLTALPVFAAADLPVDFSRESGEIRAIHGGNMGPLCTRGLIDLSVYHDEMKLPLSRLHDVPWATFEGVDISTIFRDFRNDPAQPESYDFAPTDDYIASIVKIGGPILYRLGESIEHTPRKYRVHPPRDFAKWAEICCGIIRHYNEGWAGGFRHDIRYWEVWNEPDNKPKMWTGTDEQFFEFYATASKIIKARWPNIKIGGPALTRVGKFKGDRFEPYDYLVRFLKFCRANEVPMDFFSWHRYTANPADYARYAREVRKLLDAYGYTKTESHCNEWNYLPGNGWKALSLEGQGVLRERWVSEMTGEKGAAFAAWTLSSLQGEPLDMANIFTVDNQILGMFTSNGVPRKNFYAFKAFRALLDTPRRVHTPPCVGGQIAACAGTNADHTRASVLLSNFDTTGAETTLALRHLPWAGSTSFELHLVDADHNLELVRRGTLSADGRLPIPELKAPSVVLLKLAPLAAQGR